MPLLDPPQSPSDPDDIWLGMFVIHFLLASVLLYLAKREPGPPGIALFAGAFVLAAMTFILIRTAARFLVPAALRSLSTYERPRPLGLCCGALVAVISTVTAAVATAAALVILSNRFFSHDASLLLIAFAPFVGLMTGGCATITLITRRPSTARGFSMDDLNHHQPTLPPPPPRNQ